MIHRVQRMAAFAHPGGGGNPAGVVLLEHPASRADMLKTAAEVGYSETAFLWPDANGWVVRYYSPRIEIPFCGHATVAATACLAQRKGEGEYAFSTQAGDIKARAWRADGHWCAGFVSRPTRWEQISDTVLDNLLSILDLTRTDLDEELPSARIHAGADHALIVLKSRATLSRLVYPFLVLARLQKAENWATVAVVFRETESKFHARNLFAVGGLAEDPATGAAAAALAGYLRDSAIWRGGRLTIHQGEDMGQPCLIVADASHVRGQGIAVSGLVRPMTHHEAK